VKWKWEQNKFFLWHFEMGVLKILVAKLGRNKVRANQTKVPSWYSLLDVQRVLGQGT